MVKFCKVTQIITSDLKTYAYRLEKARVFSGSGFLEKTAIKNKNHRNYLMRGIRFCGFSYQTHKNQDISLADLINTLPLMYLCRKHYWFFTYYFGLPAKKQLKTILKSNPFLDNLRPSMFNCVKKSIPYILYQSNLKEIAEIKRNWFVCCSLQWDIVPLKTNKNLAFASASQDETLKNCALIFMIRGMLKNWKQPVAYFIIEEIGAEELKNMIFNITSKLISSKLRVISTICTPSLINERALELLCNEAKHTKKNHSNFSFLCEKTEVFILYDPPSLLKQLRDLWIKYDIRHGLCGNQKTACFDDVQQYSKKILPNVHWDVNAEVHEYYRLYDEHLNPSNTQKKKLFLAKQLLSHHVASNLCVSFGRVEELIPNAYNTGTFIHFFNKLFDSVNGRRLKKQPTSGLKNAAITTTSEHVAYWKNEKRKLKTMKLIDRTSNAEVRTTHFENWFKTITNFGQIWNSIRSDDLQLFAANFNLEPLYNFIGAAYALNNGKFYFTCNSLSDCIKILVMTSFQPPFLKDFVSLRDNCPLVCNTHMYYQDGSLDYYIPKQIINPNKFLLAIHKRLECDSRMRHDFTFKTITAHCMFKLYNSHSNCECCRDFFSRHLKKKGTMVVRKLRCNAISDETMKSVCELCSLKLLFNANHFETYVFEHWFDREFAMLALNCQQHKKTVQKEFYAMVVAIYIKSTMKLANRLALGHVTEQNIKNYSNMQAFFLHLLRKLDYNLESDDELSYRTMC